MATPNRTSTQPLQDAGRRILGDEPRAGLAPPSSLYSKMSYSLYMISRRFHVYETWSVRSRTKRVGYDISPGPGSSGPADSHVSHLVISFSEDGTRFDQAFAIRRGLPALQYPDESKIRGYAYPSAVVAQDALWVAYSIGKEDIAVTHIPLSAFAAQ